MRKRYRAAVLAILFCCAAQPHAQVRSRPAPWSDPSLHQVRFVTVAPDIQLEVVDWGGAGTPLVFLAGTSFNAHAFDDLAPRFTNRHRVIAITRRGHGASSWPDSGYALPTLVQDIRAVLDALEVQRAILAGHSFAGSEMTRFAAEHPDRVAGLIYIDAAHDHTMVPALIKVCPPFDAAMMEAFHRTMKNPEMVMGTQFRTGPDGVPQPFASPSALQQMTAGLPSPDYASVGVPALGIYYVPQRFEEVAPGTSPSPACRSLWQRVIYGGIAAFANGVQRATVVALQNSQHNLHWASPDEVAAEMQRWLADLPEAQAGPEPSHQSKFVEAGGRRLHYLDFGGKGLPLVLIHSEAWDANTYQGFGGRFSGRNRVLAVTRPGYGPSEGRDSGYDVQNQAKSLIDFLDALAIDRAVFAGNASATSELTYLAENQPKRVAGVIYFTGLGLPWLEEHESDPTRAFEMFRRASPGNAKVAEIVRARSTYRPRFLRSGGAAITVPALAFVARSGMMGNELGIGALVLVASPLMSDVRKEMPPSPVRDHLERLATDEAFRLQQLEQIQDSAAREYFLRLARDSTLQAEIRRYNEEIILPAKLAGQQQFRRAFGENLRLVRLDIPQVVGYEYRDSPELIYPHVRRFLDELMARAGPDQASSTAWQCGRERDCGVTVTDGARAHAGARSRRSSAR